MNIKIGNQSLLIGSLSLAIFGIGALIAIIAPVCRGTSFELWGSYTAIALLIVGFFVGVIGVLHSLFCLVAIRGSRLQALGGFIIAAVTILCFIFMWYMVAHR